jgi:hypothetical protein
MTKLNDELRSVTCWQGHEVQQEQWLGHLETQPDGRTITIYETKCSCGESIRVRFDALGIIDEEWE